MGGKRRGGRKKYLELPFKRKRERKKNCVVPESKELHDIKPEGEG